MSEARRCNHSVKQTFPAELEMDLFCCLRRYSLGVESKQEQTRVLFQTLPTSDNKATMQSPVFIDFYLVYASGKIAPVTQQIRVARGCPIYDLIGAFGAHSTLQQYAGCYSLWKVCQLQSLVCLLKLWQPKETIKDASDLLAKFISNDLVISKFCSAIINDVEKSLEQIIQVPSTYNAGPRQSQRLMAVEQKKKVNCLVVFISELLRVPAKEGMGAVDTEPENLATRLTKGLLTYSIMLNH